MSEKKNDPAPEDDDLDLDMEFDDLDEDIIDDLEDDSWDEFDDSEDLPVDQTTQETPGKKTFLQKYFYVIVGFIILVAAAPFVLGLLSKPTQNAPTPAPEMAQTERPAPDTASPIPELAEEAGLPPMPAPMSDSAEEDIAQAQTDGDALPEIEGTLTPLPDANVMEETALAPLEVPAEPEPVLLDAETLPVDDAVTQDEGMSDLLAVPETSPIPDDLLDFAETEASKTVQDEMPAPPSSEPETETDFEILLTETSEDAPVPDDPSIPAAETETSVQDDELTAQISALQDEINTRDDKIDELSDTITDLQQQLEELTMQLQDTKTTPAASAPEAAPVPAKPKPRAEAPKVVEKQVDSVPAVAPKAPVKWIMRSAQPGQALIAKEGSEDVYAVKTGDTIKGLGRITSIAVENGKWVIRATQGIITQ